ncbi:MAG: hypothetical protein EPO16_06000 [Dehalococcoidia bacterium]|nr:MAG: hypothetical protein EPO16_06000 [Dehalococcoidia bacterium]
MGCPVEIWVPLMAAAAPFARTARDRVRSLLPKPQKPVKAAPRELHRWAPVGSSTQANEADQPAR